MIKFLYRTKNFSNVTGSSSYKKPTQYSQSSYAQKTTSSNCNCDAYCATKKSTTSGSSYGSKTTSSFGSSSSFGSRPSYSSAKGFEIFCSIFLKSIFTSSTSKPELLSGDVYLEQKSDPDELFYNGCVIFVNFLFFDRTK